MKKPNILFLLIDQLRVDRILYFKEFRELRDIGVFFPQMITYAPYTVASLHSLFAGMYGTENGVDSYYGSLDFDQKNCFTLAQYLKENGYYTKADTFSKILLPHQGFDEVSIHDEFQDNITLKHKEILEKTLTNNPFFLFLHYGKIHTGILKEVVNKFDDFDERYFSNYEENLKRYDSFVSSASSYLGSILGLCKEKGLFDNTLFIIMTDHGCSLGEREGEKCYGVFTYDYTIVTFAFFIYKNLFPLNKEIRILIRNIDIAPTILDILNLPQKKGYKSMQGQSLLPIISGNESNDREAYVETAGLSGPYPSPYKPNICAIRTKEWKLIYNESTNMKELYNLQTDPQEKVNLSGQNLEIEIFLWEKLKNRGKA